MQAFRLKGTVRLALYSSGATFAARAFKAVGNVSSMTFGFTEEEAKLADYRSASGGVDASIKRIQDFSGAITHRHMTSDNLARLLWGTSTPKTATPIVDEAGYKIVPVTFVPTNALIDTSVAPVVKKGATVVAAADYTVSASGITIAATISTAGVVSGDSITISYTPKASAQVDPLLSSAPIVSLHFEGINEVDGKGIIVKIWKATLGAAQNIALIGDDFGALEVSFTAQSDDTIVGAGVSKYAQILLQE